MLHHATSCCVTRAPRGDLIYHVAPPTDLSRFSRLYSFLTRFFEAVFGAFYCSKWVMQHTVGKLGKSTFQRYKVRVNRSSDERVMAPGSRGVWAVFSRFSGKDSGQMGDATGEPRVASRSWSCNLSNAPRLVDQLAASRKDSAREGGCSGGKNAPDFPPVFLISCLCSRARLT
jgi:hypothetical protein